jgi:hypothetical protein
MHREQQLREALTMGKYSGGIGTTEAIMMMGAIEALHSCRVELTVTTGGQAHNGAATLCLQATFPVLPGSDLPKTVKVTHTWPTQAAKTFEGLFYNLCWQLDYAIQQEYEQMPLRETE